MQYDELIFVYNANSDLLNGIIDVFHKWFSPSTYQCSLCSVTYGNVRMKKEWKNYLDRTIHKKRFIYKKEFIKEFEEFKSEDLPLILIRTGSDTRILLNSSELKNMSLNELINTLNTKLEID